MIGSIDAPELRPSRTTTREREERRPTLLLVEDDVAFAGTLNRMLAKDYVVEIVHRAEVALTRVRGGERFDAIVCAIQLPELTGLDLHTALNTCAPDQALAFIVNGTPTPAIRTFAGEMIARCVRRPFEITALRAMIVANLRPATRHSDIAGL